MIFRFQVFIVSSALLLTQNKQHNFTISIWYKSCMPLIQNVVHESLWKAFFTCDQDDFPERRIWPYVPEWLENYKFSRAGGPTTLYNWLTRAAKSYRPHGKKLKRKNHCLPAGPHASGHRNSSSPSSHRITHPAAATAAAAHTRPLPHCIIDYPARPNDTARSEKKLKHENRCPPSAPDATGDRNSSSSSSSHRSTHPAAAAVTSHGSHTHPAAATTRRRRRAAARSRPSSHHLENCFISKSFARCLLLVLQKLRALIFFSMLLCTRPINWERMYTSYGAWSAHITEQWNVTSCFRFVAARLPPRV